MPEPHRTAAGVVLESPLVATQVITDGGTSGWSLTFTYTLDALRPTAEMISNLEPLIANEPLAPLAIFTGLQTRFRLLGNTGLVGMAIAAIDMAVWDALARSYKVPLAQLLGGAEHPLRAYCGIGFEGALLCARAAEKWAKWGALAVKAKIGYPTVGEDIEVVRAIRHAVGPEVGIMVDYNQTLTPEEAIERCRRLDAEGLVWIEEPTLAHDFEGLASVATAISTPIQAGENWWGSLDVRRAVTAKSVDLLMLDVMKAGGVTGWMRCSALAEAYRLRVSSHLWPELSAQLLSVTPNAHWLEYTDWWNPVMLSPLTVKDGWVQPCSIALNEHALSQFEA
ncbi:MAG: mandelate racemase [Bryobacteraceae bacterium]|nr:mandelate racemase [Bryobacteraceae bacterium]